MMLAWVAGATAVVLAVMAVWNPYLFRMGWSHAKARPWQTVTILMGLGTAMGVVVGAAVAGDSSALAVERYERGLHRDLDLIVEPWGSDLAPHEIRALIEGSGDVERLAQASWHLFGADAVAGGSQPNTWILGVDETHPDVVGWELIDGSLDGWEAGAVLTRSQARELRTGVGDTLRFEDSFSVFRDQGGLASTRNEVTELSGRLVLAARGPTGYIHSDQDVYRVEFKPEPDLWRLNYEVTADWTTVQEPVLVLDLPNGTVYESRAAFERSIGGHAGWLPDGTYAFSLHADLAAGVDFTLHVNATYIDGTPYWVADTIDALRWDLPVVAVVEDHASPVRGSAILVHRDVLEAHGAHPFFNEIAWVFVDLAAGQDAAAVAARIEAADADGDIDVRNLVEERAVHAEMYRLVFLALWGLVGGMTIAAGLALIFVIMALIVEERRATLATLRASGATARGIASMHLAEALVYALLAMVPALILGIVMAAVLDVPLTEFDAPGTTVDLQVRPLALWAGVGISVGLVLMASAVAALRSGRLHIPTALRDEEPPTASASWPRFVGAMLLVSIGLAYLPGALQGGAVALTVAPSMFILAAAMLASLWVPRHLVFPAAAALVLVLLIVVRESTGQFATLSEVILLPARALMFCAAAAILFAYARPLHDGLAALWQRTSFGAPLQAALAYLRGRPGRAALSLFIFSLVLLGVTFLGAVAPSESEREWYTMGGYDAVGRTDVFVDDLDGYLAQNPAPNGWNPWENVERYEQVAWLGQAGMWGVPGGGASSSGAVLGVTPALVEGTTFHTVAGPPIGEAVRRLVEEPGTVLVEEPWGGDDWPAVGARIRVSGAAGEMDLTVIGHLARGGGPDNWAGPLTLQALAQNDDRDATTGLWVKADPGTDPDIVAWEVERAFPALGLRLDARPVDEVTPAVTKMFSVFTVLTLTIGAVALGLITSRNALSRQRHIGAMRALGAQRSQVVAMVMAEAVYLVVVAVVLGITGAWLSIAGLGDVVPYDIPWRWAIGLGAYAVVAASVAAWLPAWRAARLDPAVAARHVE